MVMVRLICASSLPCVGRSFFGSCLSDSLVAGVFQAIDQRSVVTNQFALCNRCICRFGLYRSVAPSYDPRPSRNTMTG